MPVCKNRFEKSARIFSRRHKQTTFSDAVFLGALRVDGNPHNFSVLFFFCSSTGAYTSHLFKLKLELGPHDEVPESFAQHADVEFTMPCSTTSQSQIRSVAVTNPNPPEKWVRYLAKYEYRIEIEHLDEYPELMINPSGIYEEEPKERIKSESDNEEEEKEPADSDSDDSSD